MTLVPPYPGSGWSSAEGPGRKIWGGGGGPPPPLGCVDIVTAMRSMLDHGPNTGPFETQSVPVTLTPPSYPAVIVVSFDIFNGGTQVGGLPVTQPPYTHLGGLAPTCTDNGHSLMDAAYRSIGAGDGGIYKLDWSCGVNGNWAFVAVAIPTAAVAPVQSAQTFGTGADVTLASAPTVGNLLVLTRQSEPLTPQDLAPPLSGLWLQQQTTHDSHASVDVSVRCVQEGDGTVWGVGTSDPVHAMQISEWAL
jgi:hypothetical protein